MEINDFDEILKETELDSAKMILRLTSELKEKDMEVAALRSKSFEEIQRNNRAKETEFEALIQGQEGRIKKRETEIARLIVEKESSLWQKYQVMLEEAITKHRTELEGERARLNEEVARKETEILEQKKHLRLEMEALFKKWETEREEDFKNERKTFIEELKLGRETARQEGEGRARQMEELWKEKLEQNIAQMTAAHQLQLEEARSRLRQEHLAEIKKLSDRLNTEFSQKERQIYEDYTKWLADNKKLLENSFSQRLSQAETDYSARVTSLEESLREMESGISGRRTQWEEKYSELKKSYSEKEAALEIHKKEIESALLTSEQALSGKYDKLEKELRLKSDKLKTDLARKEKLLEKEFAENSTTMQEQFTARERLLNERETKISIEREELNRFRNQVADTIHQRETEQTKAFEERYTLLKESIEESARVKELGLTRKYEEARKQASILAEQKDSALTRVSAISRDNEELKRLIGEKETYLRQMEEQEQARTAQLHKKFEDEFTLKIQALRAQLAAGEETTRKIFDERLRAETVRLNEQYRIKETGLAGQRDLMNAQAAELEGKFMEALKAKENENSVNIKKAMAVSNAQLENARASHARELAEVRSRSEETISTLRADFESRLKEKDLQHEQQAQAREKLAFAAAKHELDLENRKTEEIHQLKIRDMETRHHLLEQNLKFALQTRDAGKALASKLKGEIELINRKLEETEQDRQRLIQENLSKAKDLRQEIEKEFMDKLSAIEKNYLSQLADAIRSGEDKEKTSQTEYFKKLEFIKEEYNAKLARQIKDLEDGSREREARIREALEESYKLKAKALATRYEQMERNYAAALSDKTMQLDNDRSMAESITRLKSELEARNRELNSKILEHDTRLEEAQKALRNSYAATVKELEDDHRMKTAQLENERAKLKGLLEQEQRLVTDLQKREAALQENHAAKEAALIKEFSLAKEKLESSYQAKLKALGEKKSGQ
ncbi:MAG: hypothetical protein A2270_11390 [Elusimicrobia bacterium RIFOXYA12_FULL_51_18]|nr:MAG: hypothetical protein A2270_11390 [Elusimicrobia bacterium RIFOXYA12_FULL_51_18]OGS30239.1 MAG: hypothetical protein A2218_12150 [Elusimicrobia bacterium RIFOXYA2_FULL_53_38]